MNRKLRSALVALLLVFGLGAGVGLASPALANDTATSKIVNDTNYTIGGQFNFNWSYNVNLNVGPHSWQGETDWNHSYEPRAIHLGAHWCIIYHFWLYGAAGPGPDYRAGGPYDGWLNVYFGDGNTRGYDTHVVDVFAC